MEDSNKKSQNGKNKFYSDLLLRISIAYQDDQISEFEYTALIDAITKLIDRR